MLGYNFNLALKSIKSRMGITMLMVITIGIGIGLLMTTVTISYHDQKVPFAQSSDKLYMVQMDSRHAGAREVTQPNRLGNLTYRDAVNLFNADTPASAQTFNFKVLPILAAQDQQVRPMRGIVDATTASFFDIFEAKFLYGKGWEKDENNAPVIVLSKKANEQLFAGANSVGKTISVGTAKATVIGVLEQWQSQRRVFDGTYTSQSLDDAFVPYQFAIDTNMRRWQRLRCHPHEYANFNQFVRSDIQGLMNSECQWVNFWAKLDTKEQAQAYHDFTVQYVTEQKQYGRFVRPILNFVTNIDQQMANFSQRGWTREIEMLSQLFFFVCLVNAIGMLLTKFMAGTKEVSLRRALGAKKKVIMLQHLIEVSIIGLFGGLVGVVVSFAGLNLMKYVRWYSSDYTADLSVLNSAFQLDFTMVSVAIGVAVLSTIIVGLYPIWRVVNISPATQLKGA